MKEDVPEPEATEPEPTEEPTGSARTFRVATPWCTAYTFVTKDGGTLVIDRKGTVVPSTDADDLIQTAAKHGVTITEVSST